MISDAIGLKVQHHHIFKLFPDKPSGNWVLMRDEFYQQVAQLPILYSEERGGKWVTASDACVIETSGCVAGVLTKVLLESSSDSNLVKIPGFLREQLKNARRQDVKTVGKHTNN